MPAGKPKEFRHRALDLVRQGERPAQVAQDFGTCESCLRRWMAREGVDAGRKAGVTTGEHRESSAPQRRRRVLGLEA